MHLALAELLFVLLSPNPLPAPLIPGCSSASAAVAGLSASSGLTVVLGSLSTVVVNGVEAVVVDDVDDQDLRGSVAEIVLLIDELIRENRLGGTLVYDILLCVVEVE